jgi:hypothetical protein
MYASSLTIALYARSRWPRRHNQELAKVLGVSPSTAQSYVLGRRKVPASRLRQLIAYERADMATRESFILRFEHFAKEQERAPKFRSGFWLLKDWDGSGIVRNKQHKWPNRL